MPNQLNKYLIGVVALGAGIFFFVKLLTVPYSEVTDTLSLFNPVYMQHFYGKMAYPVYGLFDNMVVHPPLNYYIISFFYSLGFSLQLAILLPVFLANVLVLLILLKSYFEWEHKLVFIIALIVGSRFAFAFSNIRPDYLLSLTWFAGLICLENARIKKWSSRWLFAGAFFLSVSSVLHYFGSFAFMGVVPYLWQIYSVSEKKFFKRKLQIALLPIALIVGSYFLFQVLPNFRDTIHQIITTYQIHKTSSITKHYQVYNFLFRDSVYRKLFFLPACISAFLLLVVNKKTTALALASLPVTLFVLLFSNGKSGGYFIPEFMMFAFSISYILLSVSKMLVKSRSEKAYWILKIIIVFFLLRHVVKASLFESNSALSYYSSIGESLHRENEMMTMRACSQYLLGTQAKVGSRMDIWFVSGAKQWFNLLPDVIWGDKYPVSSLKKYLSVFDVIVDHAHFSNNTLRKDHATLSSLYVDGLLKLKGFYMTNNYDDTQPDMNVLPMLIYTLHDSDSIRGISCMNNQELKYYEQDSINFDYFLITAVVARKDKNNIPFTSFDFYNLMPLPDKEGSDYQLLNDTKEYLAWGILKSATYYKIQKELQNFARLKKTVPLKSKKISMDEVMKNLDKKVIFYKTYQDFLEAKPYYH